MKLNNYEKNVEMIYILNQISEGLFHLNENKYKVFKIDFLKKDQCFYVENLLKSLDLQIKKDALQDSFFGNTYNLTIWSEKNDREKSDL